VARVSGGERVKHKVVIVDDEPPARTKLQRFLADLSDFEVAAEADSVESARAAVIAHGPAVLYLDIQLGAHSGFDVLKGNVLEDPPLVVFTTAYSEHAVRAFELQALDYLLKPFDRDRFMQSIERTREALRQSDVADVEERVRRLLANLPERTPAVAQLLVRDSDRTIFVPTDDVLRIAAADNYVEVFTPTRKHLLRETLSSLAAQLDPARFLRVHRSHIVRVDFIGEIRPWFHGDYQLILRDGTELNLSRRFKALLPAGIRDRL
jgi:two-component system LytT family response regulator